MTTVPAFLDTLERDLVVLSIDMIRNLGDYGDNAG